MDNSSIISFMRGGGVDQNGQTLCDYFTFTAEEMEKKHDWIQWAFPTPNPSRFNPQAPTLSLRDCTLLWRDSGLKNHFYLPQYAIANRWLDSLEYAIETGRITQHNYLRLSRLLEFMILLSFGCRGDSFEQTVEVYNEFVDNSIDLLARTTRVIAEMYKVLPPYDAATTYKIHDDLSEVAEHNFQYIKG